MKSLSQNLRFMSVLLLLLGTGDAQLAGTVNGQAFTCAAIGLSYTIPKGFDSTPENQLPHDPKGREHILLALWEHGHRTPVPRIVFLYDDLARPSSLTAEMIAEDYLKSLEPGEGYKMGTPKRIELTTGPMWRLDYWRADEAGQSHNSAIAVPTAGHKVLFIQMNASSEAELNALVISLRSLRLGSKASAQ